MHQKQPRAKELARRTFVYALMVIAVIVLLFLLTFNMLGYRFNFDTQQVEQRGLIQYDSQPQGAKVFIDGAEVGTTHTKAMASAGQHQISMQLKGYDEWRKVVEIKPGTLTWLSYVRFVPSQRVVDTAHKFSALQSAAFSPDHKWLLGVVSASDEIKVVWGDLRDSNKLKFTEQLLDKTVVRGYDKDAVHAVKIMEWDSGGRYAALKHTYAVDGQEQTQWLWLDRETQKVVDIGAKVGLSLNDVRFIGTGGSEMYILQTSGEIRHINLGNGTISTPLISNVQAFSVYSTDYIAYVGTDGASSLKLAGVWRKNWESPVIVRKLTEAEATQPFAVKFSRYDSKDTVVVAVGDKVMLYRGLLDGSDKSATQKFLATSKSLSSPRPLSELIISGEGRFVIMRSEAGFVSYDIERQSMSPDIAVPADAKLNWLDNYHLWSVENGSVVMREFDGTNHAILTKGAAGLDAVFSPDNRYLYTFMTGENGSVVMQRLKMTVEQ